jgi:hypothetical protein
MQDTEYTGYWDPANPVTTGNKDVLASVYLKENKAMIAIGNWTDTDQTVNLQIDWKKLGMNPETATVEIPAIDGLQTAGVANVKQLHIAGSKGLILIINK